MFSTFKPRFPWGLLWMHCGNGAKAEQNSIGGTNNPRRLPFSGLELQSAASGKNL